MPELLEIPELRGSYSNLIKNPVIKHHLSVLIYGEKQEVNPLVFL